MNLAAWQPKDTDGSIVVSQRTVVGCGGDDSSRDDQLHPWCLAVAKLPAEQLAMTDRTGRIVRAIQVVHLGRLRRHARQRQQHGETG
jgi:hypothetical protein